MKLSATAPFCFAATVFTSRCCFAADSSHLRRERERNGDLLLIVDTVRSSGRRVNQVYLEQPPGSADNNIQIPKESIPLTLLSSQADQTPRRELSFWSSIFNALHICPFPDDHNSHCHHHHAEHSSSSGGGCGEGEQCDEGNDDADDDNDDNNDNDDNDDNDNDFEDNVSNDHSCWWCTPEQRDNGNSVSSSFSGSFGTGAGGSTLAYGFIAIAGIAGAVVASAMLKKRCNSTSSDTSDRDSHLLRGAVGKRKKKVSTVLKHHDDSKMSSESASVEIVGNNNSKRKRFLSRIFGGRGNSNKIDQAPVEIPSTGSSHYVRV